MEDRAAVIGWAEDFAAAGQVLSTLLENDPKGRRILKEYAWYLLGEKPRSYVALTDFLEWYGQHALLPGLQHMLHVLAEQITLPSRAIELGPGTGWLINTLGNFFESRVAVDKRQALYQRAADVGFLVQDMEENPLLGYPGDSLIIANQFLHCVDNPEEIIRVNRQVWLVVEVGSAVWMEQMRRFGATPISKSKLTRMFQNMGYELLDSKSLSALYIMMWTPT